MEETLEYGKPLPLADDDTKPFWDLCRQHILATQKCSNCGGRWFYPRDLCPHCSSREWEWSQVSGRGTVYSWIVVHHVVTPGFKEEAPYTVLLVSLEEDPRVRICANLVNGRPEDLHDGMPVRVLFKDVVPTDTLYFFEPAS